MSDSGQGDAVLSGSGEEELWTTGQAAAYLKDLAVSRRQVYRMLGTGELPAIQSGSNRWHRIPARAVRAYRERLLAQIRDVDGR